MTTTPTLLSDAEIKEIERKLHLAEGDRPLEMRCAHALDIVPMVRRLLSDRAALTAAPSDGGKELEEAAIRAFDDEHELWDYMPAARGTYVVTRGDAIQLTAMDELVAEGEMKNMRDEAGVRAAVAVVLRRQAATIVRLNDELDRLKNRKLVDLDKSL